MESLIFLYQRGAVVADVGTGCTVVADSASHSKTRGEDIFFQDTHVLLSSSCLRTSYG